MEKVNKLTYIKFNEQIVPKPEGIDYDLIPGKVYDLLRDRDDLYLKETKDFEFPAIYYLNDDDKRFIQKVITTFNETSKLTTGVMFSGLKGSGKSLMAKKLAVESGLPIIVVDQNVYPEYVEPFFAKTDTPCCIIFDEIDKFWNTKRLLNFLDGVKPSCKKLVLCTCNSEKDLDEFINDRCSRIRYKKLFTSLTKEAINAVLLDILKDEEKAKAATEYVNDNVKVISYDNVFIFGEEIKAHPEQSFDEIIADLNVKTKYKEKIQLENKLAASVSSLETIMLRKEPEIINETECRDCCNDCCESCAG